MLMHFHFGLGVGHVYSHCYAHFEPQGGSADVQHTAENGTEDEYEEYEDDEEDKDEESEDDCTMGELTLEQHFSVSNESLSHFGEMYDSELEVDYEN
jgi:hypothetical protein